MSLIVNRPSEIFSFFVPLIWVSFISFWGENYVCLLQNKNFSKSNKFIFSGQMSVRIIVELLKNPRLRLKCFSKPRLWWDKILVSLFGLWFQRINVPSGPEKDSACTYSASRMTSYAFKRKTYFRNFRAAPSAEYFYFTAASLRDRAWVSSLALQNW